MTISSPSNRLPEAALPPSEGATLKVIVPKDGISHPVSGRKKPGLKPGQKIRRASKLKPAQIQSIALAIRERSMESPERPFTYAELEGAYGVSAVTLRSKPPIRMAVEDARKAASAKQKAKIYADAVAPDDEPSKTLLRERITQLTQELENYRILYQRLALMYRMRGEQMPQIVAEAESLVTGKPISPSQIRTDVANTIAPIYRK